MIGKEADMMILRKYIFKITILITAFVFSPVCAWTITHGASVATEAKAVAALSETTFVAACYGNAGLLFFTSNGVFLYTAALGANFAAVTFLDDTIFAAGEKLVAPYGTQIVFAKYTVDGEFVSESLYGFGDYDKAISLTFSDGYWYLLAQCDSGAVATPNGFCRIYKINNIGMLLDTFELDCIPSGMVVKNEDTIYVVGHQFTAETDAILAKLSSNYGLISIKHFGVIGIPDRFSSVCLVGDTVFVVGERGLTADAFVLALDCELEEVWRWEFHGCSTDKLSHVASRADGSIIATGTTGSYGTYGRMLWMVCLDSDGSENWARIYGESTQHAGSSATILPEGIIACGKIYNTTTRVFDSYFVATNVFGYHVSSLDVNTDFDTTHYIPSAYDYCEYIDVYNLQGHKVFNCAAQKFDLNDFARNARNSFPAGIYLARFCSPKGENIKKIIICK